MESVGIVRNETFDNKVYYSANPKHPFFKPLIDMFSKKPNAKTNPNQTNNTSNQNDSKLKKEHIN